MLIMPTSTVSDVRKMFIDLLEKGQFTENKNKTGSKTVEIIGASFIADEEAIFGEVNREWVERESRWYHGQSRNVNDIPGGAPQIWKMVATPDGRINSNYGWMIYSDENYNQFDNCAKQLEADEQTRRAVMIYNRPSMQVDYNKDGMSDFCCTFAVQYFIRDDELISIVSFRSNDAVFGYKNDKAWNDEVHQALHKRLIQTYPNLKLGPMVWNAGSIHVYARHFELIKEAV